MKRGEWYYKNEGGNLVKEIVFEVQTITPMFLRGADGKTPELRAPTIKAMMRFWWRALNGHLGLNDLRTEEAKIFGSSVGEGKSKFNVVCENVVIKTKEEKVLERKHKKFRARSVEPGTKFKITLSTFYREIEYYSNILKVTLLLGGLGARARRGAGSVRIIGIEGKDLSNIYDIKEIIKLINAIGENNYQQDRSEKTVALLRMKKECAPKSRFSYLKEVEIGAAGKDGWKPLRAKIDEASHNHKDDSLGFEGGGKRLASPIYISIIKKNDNKYYPIISTLNTVFEDKKTSVKCSVQTDFKEAILNE